MAENRWKFLLDGNIDVSVFLFDCNPQAMRGTGSPMAVGNYSSGGDRSEQSLWGCSSTQTITTPSPYHLSTPSPYHLSQCVLGISTWQHGPGGYPTTSV